MKKREETSHNKDILYEKHSYLAVLFKGSTWKSYRNCSPYLNQHLLLPVLCLYLLGHRYDWLGPATLHFESTARMQLTHLQVTKFQVFLLPTEQPSFTDLFIQYNSTFDSRKSWQEQHPVPVNRVSSTFPNKPSKMFCCFACSYWKQ